MSDHRGRMPMTDGPAGQGPLQAGSPLRTPRAAAVAGIVFSVLLIAALVLLRLSVPAYPVVAGVWLTDPERRAAIAIALNLVPFAGIAFLWFIGVLRDRIGEREDRFFATVFLGSGLLFVGMLFVAAAVAGGLIAEASQPSGPPGADTVALSRNVNGILVNIYAMRMAAVFTLTTVTIARRTKIVARWLTVAGIAVALILLVGVGISAWVELLFPAWILALSVDILTAGRKVFPRQHGDGSRPLGGCLRRCGVLALQQRPGPAADHRQGRDQQVRQVIDVNIIMWGDDEGDAHAEPAAALPAGGALSPKTDSGRSEMATNSSPIRTPARPAAAAKYTVKSAGTTGLTSARSLHNNAPSVP